MPRSPAFSRATGSLLQAATYSRSEVVDQDIGRSWRRLVRREGSGGVGVAMAFVML